MQICGLLALLVLEMTNLRDLSDALRSCLGRTLSTACSSDTPDVCRVNFCASEAAVP